MVITTGICPHCGEKSGFRIFALSEYTSERSIKELEKIQVNEPTFSHPNCVKPASFFGAGTCCYCGNPILADLAVDDAYVTALYEHIRHSDKLYNGPIPVIKRLWPEPVLPYSHPALSGKVRSLFTDIQRGLEYKMSAPWIISGCRSVLEEAVKELGGKGKDLLPKIESLREEAVVNGVLAEWAHHVRIEGNEAVHELEGTPEEAAELVEFTKLFLQYTFEFPARVREVRSKA